MVDVRPVVALPSRVHDVHVHQGRTVASLHHLVAHLEKKQNEEKNNERIWRLTCLSSTRGSRPATTRACKGKILALHKVDISALCKGKISIKEVEI